MRLLAIFGLPWPMTLCSQLGLDQPQFVSIRVTVRFYNAHQSLEVFHILHGCHFVGLVECQHSVLHTFECVSTMLVIVKLAAVPCDDWQQLDHILVGIGLDVHVRYLDLAVKL
jgi:hypothetical protein